MKTEPEQANILLQYTILMAMAFVVLMVAAHTHCRMVVVLL
jgi:hypothetical protein